MLRWMRLSIAGTVTNSSLPILPPIMYLIGLVWEYIYYRYRISIWQQHFRYCTEYGQRARDEARIERMSTEKRPKYLLSYRIQFVESIISHFLSTFAFVRNIDPHYDRDGCLPLAATSPPVSHPHCTAHHVNSPFIHWSRRHHHHHQVSTVTHLQFPPSTHHPHIIYHRQPPSIAVNMSSSSTCPHHQHPSTPPTHRRNSASPYIQANPAATPASRDKYPNQ
jgi:hypothetical protein